jgi:drug/metabolite transporter (DMT)-like permease
VTRRLWCLLLPLSATWGGSFVFLSIALRAMSATTVVFGRLAIGGAVLATVTVCGNRRAFAVLRGRWARLTLCALFEMVLPYLLIAWGERRIPSGLASLLVSTQPMWLMLLGPLIMPGSRICRERLTGVAVGLAGVVALANPFGIGGRVDLLGVSLVVAAAAAYAAGALLVSRLLPDVPALPLTAAGQSVAALLVAPFAALALPRTLPAVGPLVALTVLGTVCTAGGYLLFNRLVIVAGADRAGLVAYLAPLFAVGYGAVLLREQLRPAMLLGLVLVLAGSLLVTRPRPNTSMARDQDAIHAG